MVTFFNEDETVDYDSITEQVQRLLCSGIAGLVIHGSNGEAIREERTEIIQHVRKIADERQLETALIAGCSANSVRETLSTIAAAEDAGANLPLCCRPATGVRQ
jgi:2-keto-3-deoxy-L-rhamnonate aldolase